MDDRNLSAFLEGIHRDLLKHIEDGFKQIALQQAKVYERVETSVGTGVENILAQHRYLAQQNSTIHDFAQSERAAVRDAILGGLQAQEKALDEKIKQQEEELSALRTQIEALKALLEEKFGKLNETIDSEYKEISGRLGGTETETEGENGETPAGTGEETPLPDDGINYDELAEKIASILPEVDYDLITDKVAAAIPQVDADVVADKVAAALPQTDEHAIADRVAEAVPLTDYDLIAERVAAVIEEKGTLSDETVDRIARRIVELLREGGVAIPTEAPVRSEAEQTGEIAVTATPVVPVPVPVVPTVEDETKTVRYKRSFVAKIIESEEEIKGYYSDLKNAILSYGKVRSQINWTNDRFSVENDSVIKIGIRGKTLCVYFALDPNEFPTSVYHQKFAGDVKMYEMTPMMIKIKSKGAVKRAIRLTELLMERYGLVKEAREPVDYAAQYFFRTEEELLAEGYIKTAIVDRSDLDF